MKKLMIITLFTPLLSFSQAIVKDALFFQNSIRSYYNLQPLEIDHNLNQEAQDWANYIALNNLFEHEDDHYGETLYSIDKQYYNPAIDFILDASVHWILSEDDDNLPFHQITYKESKRVGFGIAENDEYIYVVAKYDKLYQQIIK